MLTRTFLLEEDLHPKHSKLLRAVKDHEATFTSLKRSHNEAKSEWWNARIQRSSEAYEAAIGTLTRLAQHVGGLRSGLNLQRELAMRGGKTVTSLSALGDESRVLDALETAFGDFVEELAPPMHALMVLIQNQYPHCFASIFLTTQLAYAHCSRLALKPSRNYARRLSGRGRACLRKCTILMNSSQVSGVHYTRSIQHPIMHWLVCSAAKTKSSKPTSTPIMASTMVPRRYV